jgi:hypothetical protein
MFITAESIAEATAHQTSISSLHFSLGAVYCQRLQEVETTSRDDNKKETKKRKQQRNYTTHS